MSPKRLTHASSLYLRQHADNPVDWCFWEEEALAAAKSQNKPILLSIGYSACHWCHVMAHESFEDEETANLMNEFFINIKVDREERPDLDKIYQTAHQLLAQKSGGWPLTVFLTPDDHTPFFTGTYFPKDNQYGRPAFKDVLQHIHGIWRSKTADIYQQNLAFHKALMGLKPQSSPQTPLTQDPIEQAFIQLSDIFDSNKGGFGKAPKFPHPNNLRRILHHWHTNQHSLTPKRRAMQMLETTLSHMALGGINDQLEGGFYHYSVDNHWEIPHFEKMLCDNGSLLSIYSQFFHVTGTTLFRQTAHSIAQWAIKVMQAPNGGFYSSIDADSESLEGKFYVWKKPDLKQRLTDEEFDVTAKRFGLYEPANFDDSWHLHCDPSKNEPMLNSFDEPFWQSAKQKLLGVRNQRIKPSIDSKILTSWNALMIKGLAIAGRTLKHAEYLDVADNTLAFIQENLWLEGRLLAVYNHDKATLNAYLDDYVFLIDALLENLTSRWNKRWLYFAIDLTEVLLCYFQDRESGGFYFTSDDHEQLIHRPKPFNDEAMPSGNGIAANVLYRLGYLLGNTDYIDAADRLLNSAWASMSQYPHAHCSLLNALEEKLRPSEYIILRGEEEELDVWQEILEMNFNPQRYVLSIPNHEHNLPGALQDKAPKGHTIAYICQGMNCRQPIEDIEQISDV